MPRKPSNSPYRPLFERYKKELKAIHTTLLKERDEAIRRIQDEEGVNKPTATRRFDEENGPLVHDGRVVHIIRKYWLEIDRMKKEALKDPKGAFLEPLTFLVEDLIDDDEEELVEFLTQIAYWPIGRDEKNEWT